jgi:D-sedoheptulose 7-phosphate isomerase
MTSERWDEYVDTIAAGLRGLEATDRSGASLSARDAMAQWVALTREVHDRDAQLFLFGNGGSAAMAAHMATDACKNGHLRAMAFTDAALLTATSNDLAYDQVFSLPLERLARKGDLAIAISSSGNSPNVVRALETAQTIGVESITLTAKAVGNRCRTLGTLNFYVPLRRYGWAESAHQILLHYWFDEYLNRFGNGAM